MKKALRPSNQFVKNEVSVLSERVALLESAGLGDMTLSKFYRLRREGMVVPGNRYRLTPSRRVKR